MRKILLATSALLGAAVFAAPAHADLTVKTGGYADFRAGYFDESLDIDPTSLGALNRNDYDFETEVKVNIDVMGKGAQGVEYGARVALWNGSNNAIVNGGEENIRIREAYVYAGGSWGKVILGDEEGASNHFVYAPTIGTTKQLDGNYTDFTSTATYNGFFPSYIDNTETSTKVTYETPSISGFKAAVSYTPEFADVGQNAVKFKNTGVNGPASAYRDVVEIAGGWAGTFSNVGVKLTGQVLTGDANNTVTPGLKDFTSWGLGGQVSYMGFTVGGSYVDGDDYQATTNQNRDQQVWSIGGKYEVEKAAIAVAYLKGEGYGAITPNATGLAATMRGGAGVGDGNYIDESTVWSVGATYNWLPGLVTGLDYVDFDQEGQSSRLDNDGQVFLITQSVQW